MTQPNQEPTLGDLVLRDLESQLAVDARYAAKCRELALIRAQYQQLLAYVKSKADVLGLETVEEPADEGQASANEEKTPDQKVAEKKLTSVPNSK